MADAVYNLRGANREAFLYKEHEYILAGARDTGKTISCCLKAHRLCEKYPGAQGAVVRKVYNDMSGTVLQSFNRVVANRGVDVIGGNFPSRYVYPNGSQLWIIGLDKAGKVLSSERDFLYVNQAEQISLDDWEMMAGSCSGRGAVVPNPQLFGDCNPAGSNHWIQVRAKAGQLKLFSVTHKDNPSLYNEAGEVASEDAKKRLAVLNSLTGIRRQRLLLGIWATAEGAVYEFSQFGSTVEEKNLAGIVVTRQIGPHVFTRDPAEFRRWVLAVDEGFTNPAVTLLVGIDNDGRWHVFREFHQSGVLPATHVELTRSWFMDVYGALGCQLPPPDKEGKQAPRTMCEMAAVDEAAAGMIADLKNVGVNAKPGKGRKLDGINKIQDRLACAGDGRPRLAFDPSCTETINEMESYIRKPGSEEPVKENDHGPDCLRYLSDVLGEPTGAISSAAGIYVGNNDSRFGSPRVFVPRHFEPRRLK